MIYSFEQVKDAVVKAYEHLLPRTDGRAGLSMDQVIGEEWIPGWYSFRFHFHRPPAYCSSDMHPVFLRTDLELLTTDIERAEENEIGVDDIEPCLERYLREKGILQENS